LTVIYKISGILQYLRNITCYVGYTYRQKMSKSLIFKPLKNVSYKICKILSSALDSNINFG